MSREVEDRIAAAAARQHSIVTRDQLLAAGLSSYAIGRRLRSGRLRPVHRGIYLVGPLVPPLALEKAAVFACDPGAVLSHLSAASLWGQQPPLVSTEPIDVSVTDANRGRRPGIRVHRVVRFNADERTILHSIPITTPGRTLLDLADVVGRREMEAAVARSEREGLVDRVALSALLARHRGRPGTRALRAVLEISGGPALTRSEAEAMFLALVRKAGLPVPETNVKLGPYEIDFLWRSAGIGVEVDGFQYHSSRPRFEGDRRRDARLMAAGISVVRLSWRQITHEAMATAVQLGQALVRAGDRRCVTPRLLT